MYESEYARQIDSARKQRSEPGGERTWYGNWRRGNERWNRWYSVCAVAIVLLGLSMTHTGQQRNSGKRWESRRNNLQSQTTSNSFNIPARQLSVPFHSGFAHFLLSTFTPCSCLRHDQVRQLLWTVVRPKCFRCRKSSYRQIRLIRDRWNSRCRCYGS